MNVDDEHRGNIITISVTISSLNGKITVCNDQLCPLTSSSLRYQIAEYPTWPSRNSGQGTG